MAKAKLIKYLPGKVNNPEDPSLPFKLVVHLRPPEFMMVAFIGLYGGREEVIVQAIDPQDFEPFIKQNGFRDHHPRLIHMTITGPEGVVEHIGREEAE